MTTQRAFSVTRLSDSTTVYVATAWIKLWEPDVAPNATGSIIHFDQNIPYQSVKMRVTDAPATIATAMNT